MANRFVDPLPQFLDANGDPYSGGSLEFYESGTSTPLTTYSDDALTTPNSNPLDLDSAGRPANPVFLQPLDYKVALKDSGGGTVWTQDPVRGGGQTKSITYTPDYTGASTVNLRDHLDTRSLPTYTELRAILPSDALGHRVVRVLGRDSQADGGEGVFVWDGSDLSTEVGNDEVTASEGNGGIYVAPSSDKTGASGAWVRAYVGTTRAAWYGSSDVPIYEPMRFSEFLRRAGGDAEQALKDAIDELYGSLGSYRNHLDLEGRSIELSAPIVFPSGGFQIRSMRNGEITAGSGFTQGSYLFDMTGTGNHLMTFQNMTFIGNDLANWVQWDDGDINFTDCYLRNNDDTGAAFGLDSGSKGHIHMDHCDLFVNDGSVNPDNRNRLGITGQLGDQKISDSIFAYFKHAMVWPSSGGPITIHGCHIFQGVSGGTDTDPHTAGIKFTGGVTPAIVTGLYLDKCFIESSNEDNTTATGIGGQIFDGVTTLLSNGETGFAFFRVNDYGSNSGVTIYDMQITNGRFVNFGSTAATLTAVDNIANFDRLNFDRIIVKDNTFNSAVTAQANPIRRRKTFTSSTQHAFDVGGQMAFAMRPYAGYYLSDEPSSGAGEHHYVGNVNRASDIIRFDTANNWAGDLIVEITGNQEDGNGVIYA